MRRKRENDPDRLVGEREIAAYSIAGGGQCFGYGLVTGYLMYFYINVFHIDPRVVGVMLFVEGIWDIVNNPLAGVLIDRTRTPRGKMIPWLRRFCAPLALFTVLLFAGPYIIRDPSPLSAAKIVFMFVTYFLWEICYTVMDVSYWGLSAAISPYEGDRSRVMTRTNIAMNIGNVIPFVVMPLMMDYAAMDQAKLQMRTVFLLFGLVAGVVGIGLFSLSGFFVKERIEQSEEKPGLRESLGELVHNPALRTIVISGLIRSVAGINTVFMNYYFIDVLGYASLGVLLQLPSAITWLFSYSLLPVLRRRFNQKQCLLVGSMAFGVIWLLIYLIGVRWYANVAVMMPVIMLGQSIFGLFASSLDIFLNEMMADATDYTEWKTGKRNEGLGFSMKIVTNKISGTIIQSIASLLLAAIGYVTSSETARAPQPAAVQSRIFMVYTLLPGVLFILSAIPFFFYDLVGEKRDRMRRELTQRRAQARESLSAAEDNEIC